MATSTRPRGGAATNGETEESLDLGTAANNISEEIFKPPTLDELLDELVRSHGRLAELEAEYKEAKDARDSMKDIVLSLVARIVGFRKDEDAKQMHLGEHAEDAA